MAKPIIEDMRASLLDAPFYKETVRKQNIRKFKEEFKMANQFPGAFPQPPQPAGGAPTPPVPQPAGGATNVAKLREDELKTATKRSFEIRPLGLVTDGAEIYRYDYDTENSELQSFIKDWESDPKNQKEDKISGKMVPKSINTIRAVKELCMKTGKKPADFAKYDPETGKPVLKLKKPSVKGFILKFPGTEGTGEYIDIVKKSNLSDAIQRAGGFQLAGNYMEDKINPDKLEIPVALALLPTKRKTKDAQGRTEVKHLLRISGQMVKELQKSFFPGKNNVGMYDMFDIYPKGNYKYNRVVPLKLYKTEVVDGKNVGVLDLDPEQKLARYESFENPLTSNEHGKEFMEAIGKGSAELQASFARKSGGAANETEEDLLSLIMNAYVGADSDPTIADKYVNNILRG